MSAGKNNLHSEITRTRKSSAVKRRRGASLVHVLAITGTCCILSAVLFPTFATPSEETTVDAVETATAASAGVIYNVARQHAIFQLHRKIASLHCPAGKVHGVRITGSFGRHRAHIA